MLTSPTESLSETNPFKYKDRLVLISLLLFCTAICIQESKQNEYLIKHIFFIIPRLTINSTNIKQREE